MLSLFRPTNTPVISPYYRHEFRNTLRSIMAVNDYYKTSNRSVLNTHPVVKLIDMVYVNTPDINTYRRQVIGSLGDIAPLLDIGTLYRPGKLMGDEFVGGVSRCMMWVNLDHRTSEYTAPIEVVSHPYTNTSLPILNGTFVQTPPRGVLPVTTYIINGWALMRGFFHYMQQMEDVPHKGPRHYVHSIVLPQMLYSWWQHAMWNQCWYEEAGIPLTTEGNNIPIGTLQLRHSQIDIVNAPAEWKRFSRNGYEELLRYPVERGYALYRLLQMPAEITLTRTTAAFLWMSRIRDIHGLITVGGKALVRKDKMLINKLGYEQRITKIGGFLQGAELQHLYELGSDYISSAFDFLKE